MIPLKDCKDGYLYHIDARNAGVGIYNQAELGFIISRYKFSNNFLFTEYHWDIGTVKPDMACFGTAKPLKEIGPVPVLSDKEKLAYLNQQENI